MEQAIPQRLRRYSAEQYLQMEERSDIKHEFRDGQIFDMARGTFEHAQIAANIIGELGNRFKGKSCKAVGSDVRVRIPGTGNYCYPDVSVVCEQPVFDLPDRQTTLVNPQVVIEVASPSTETLDRTDKFYDYMRVESLREYFLVSQDRQRVDTFYRQNDGVWAIGPSVSGADGRVRFRTLDVEWQ